MFQKRRFFDVKKIESIGLTVDDRSRLFSMAQGFANLISPSATKVHLFIAGHSHLALWENPFEMDDKQC